MTTATKKIPGPDHPITVERTAGRVVVSLATEILADSAGALTLREADYPPVYYVPRADVNMAMLERTSHTTYCPYKGDCSYYSIRGGGTRSENGVWTYEHPYDAVSEIRDHLAFYPAAVDGIEVQ